MVELGFVDREQNDLGIGVRDVGVIVRNTILRQDRRVTAAARVETRLVRTALSRRAVTNKESPVHRVHRMKGQPKQSAFVKKLVELRKLVCNVEERSGQELTVLDDPNLAGLIRNEQASRSVSGMSDAKRRSQSRHDWLQLNRKVTGGDLGLGEVCTRYAHAPKYDDGDGLAGNRAHFDSPPEGCVDLLDAEHTEHCRRKLLATTHALLSQRRHPTERVRTLKDVPAQGRSCRKSQI